MSNKTNEMCQLQKTPPMVLNEVSRLCMSLLYQISGESGGDKQHSRRLILMKLSKNDGISQVELVAASKMKASTISIALKNLENEGLVERRGDSNDLRVTRVYLTDKGRSVNEKNRERIWCVDSIMMKGITNEEQASLMELLMKMRANLIKELGEKNEID